MVPELIFRQRAAQSTFNKYYDTEFRWGERDCVHLAAYAVRELGHNDPLEGTSPYGTYRGARKAMKKAGIESFEELLDQMFERIPPAAALPGDIVTLPGLLPNSDAAPWSALGVSIGDGRVLAYIGAGDVHACCFGPSDECTAAWRVPPVAPAEGAR